SAQHRNRDEGEAVAQPSRKQILRQDQPGEPRPVDRGRQRDDRRERLHRFATGGWLGVPVAPELRRPLVTTAPSALALSAAARTASPPGRRPDRSSVIAAATTATNALDRDLMSGTSTARNV